MSSVLDRILAQKRSEVAEAKQLRPLDALKALPGFIVPRRNFYGAVAAPQRPRPNLIAEIKRKSPSAGVIRTDFDPVAIAQVYAAAGAVALSVLTDAPFFDGRLEYIGQVKGAVGLPVLRKDFLVDEYQLYESRAFGADAVLIIGEALPTAERIALVELARQLELAVLLEVHERKTLIDTLLALDEQRRGHVLLGINNRDLKTQTVDLGTTETLADLGPPGVPIVAESGIQTRQDVDRMHAAGARALLIGERFMRADDIAVSVRELFG